MCCVRLKSKPANVSGFPVESKGSQPHKKDDFPFVTIYDQFPHALQVFKFDRVDLWAAFSNSKRVMLPFSVILLTYALMQEADGSMDHETVTTTAFLLICFGVSYYSATIPLNNLVGFVYIDQETEDIIVSYVDFWGRRQEKIFRPGDLYFKARDNQLDKLFIFLISRRSGDKFRIHFRHSDVYSQEVMERYLGKIPDSAF